MFFTKLLARQFGKSQAAFMKLLEESAPDSPPQNLHHISISSIYFLLVAKGYCEFWLPKIPSLGEDKENLGCLKTLSLIWARSKLNRQSITLTMDEIIDCIKILIMAETIATKIIKKKA